MGRWNPLIGMGDDGLRSPARENQAGDLGEESYHLLETVEAGKCAAATLLQLEWPLKLLNLLKRRALYPAAASA